MSIKPPVVLLSLLTATLCVAAEETQPTGGNDAAKAQTTTSTPTPQAGTADGKQPSAGGKEKPADMAEYCKQHTC